MTELYQTVPKTFHENLEFRLALRRRAEKDFGFQEAMMTACKHDVLFFFNAFCWLYEPRPQIINGVKLPMQLPFITWEHQDPAILQIDKYLGYEDIGAEKSRGEGASWIAIYFATRDWLFNPMTAIGLVSKSELSVDNPNDSDSLMWKIDWSLTKLPPWMGGVKGVDYTRNVSDHTLKNLRNGSMITGYAASGDVASGGRKAQPLDAKILTPSGWKTMGDMRVGSKVIGQNGLPASVAAVTPQGVVPIYEITFSDGSKVQCCDDHLWKVYRSERGVRIPDIKSTKELRRNYFRIIGVAKKRRNVYSIPTVEPIEFDEKVLPVDPYLLGVLLGDGGLTQRRALFTTVDQEIVDSVAAAIPDTLCVKKTHEIQYAISSPRRGMKNNALVRSLKSIGVMGKYSYEKFIPDEYKFSSKSQRLEILRGLMDTDGSVCVVNKGRPSCAISFTSTSKALCEDVQFLVESLGGTASMKMYHATCLYKGVTSDCRDQFTILIGLPPGTNPFRMTRKSKRVIDRTRYLPCRKIIDIQYVGDKEAQCITVASEDGLYVTDRCVVTHNSWFAMDELAKFPRGPDTDAMASTQHVTNSRLIISTPKGADGEYYRVMHEPSSMVKIILDWKDNPSRNRGLYTLVAGQPVAVDSVKNPLPSHYNPPTREVLDLFSRLRRKGFKLEDCTRSPWFDHECDRASATPHSIAQELGRDYGGSMHRIFGHDFHAAAGEFLREPTLRGLIDYNTETLEPTFDKSSDGPVLLWTTLDIYNRPPAHPYVVSCDIGSGLGGSYTSNSVVEVIDLATREQVLEYATNTTEPGDFADESIAIAKMFHGAYLAWEANGPGSAFTKRVKERKYGNVFMRPQLTKRGVKKSKDMGWWTSTDSKEALFTDMNADIVSKEVTIHSKMLASEFAQYVRKGTGIEHVLVGKTEDETSMGKAHGDRVMAFGVGLQAMRDRPLPSKNLEDFQNTNPPPNSIAARMKEYEDSRTSEKDQWDDRDSAALARTGTDAFSAGRDQWE